LPFGIDRTKEFTHIGLARLEHAGYFRPASFNPSSP
jgi:hypothetical protein